MLSRENFHDSHAWHNSKMLLQDTQTGRPLRPPFVWFIWSIWFV